MRLDWPEGAASRESMRAVWKLPRLQVIGSFCLIWDFLSVHNVISSGLVGEKVLKVKFVWIASASACRILPNYLYLNFMADKMR